MNDTISNNINSFIAAWDAKSEVYFRHNFPNTYPADNPTPKLIRTDGKRYAKIVRESSVLAFVDLNTGNILMPASWAAPAKGVRGSVLAPDFGISAAGPYGVVYLRGGNYGW